MGVRIYTRGGDKGMTSIHGGTRVAKDDIRIEAIGSLDELNSVLGVVRSFMHEQDDRHELLYLIQREMMVIMSLVATPSGYRAKNPNVFDEDLILTIEEQIDKIADSMPENDYFILPGGNSVSAHFQWARTIARRSERRLWTLHRADELPQGILQFINRLSDLFFVMGREELLKADRVEEKWKKFLYKRKLKK